MSVAFTPSICHINLSAIARNFQRLGHPEQLLPVIKSDAYGHGLAETAQALSNVGAQRFAVGLADEGSVLRQLGHKQLIIVLMGCLCPGDWEMALRYQLMPIIGNFENLKLASELMGRHPGKTMQIAIKADTGMSRLGFSLADIGSVIDFLTQNPALKPGMLLSHLACADMPEEEEFTKTQMNLFDSFYEALSSQFPGLPRSLGNSAATLKDHKYELGRPGLALYGANPLPGPDITGLEWAMAVSTPIIQIREIAPGQSVSYGRTFVAKKPMRIAVVACGYATGFSRKLSNNAEMLVNGQRVRQVGRICMSMSCLDISNIPDAKPGDRAWIMGGEGENPVTAQEIADKLETIPYEILCLLGELNPRVYYR